MDTLDSQLNTVVQRKVQLGPPVDAARNWSLGTAYLSHLKLARSRGCLDKLCTVYACSTEALNYQVGS